MKTVILLFCAGFTIGNLFGQVGIGTVNPTSSSMLEVSSTSDGGITYKGLMPPRVPNIATRDAINPSVSDIGLLVFVENIGCLQIWNGSGWESVHCINNIGFIDLFQNFDLNTSWGYSSDVPFFDNGTDGFYGVTNQNNGGFNNLSTMTNNFVGILDLRDDNDGGNGGSNGTTGFATITFDTINVLSASNGISVSFDYEFFEYDNGDDAYYTIIIDGIAQPEVTLILGITDLSLSGDVIENIPGGTTSVSLIIKFKQNGEGDYAGFDNFAIVAN